MELLRKEVEFHNSKLVGIQKDGKIYTPIEQFCEALGLDSRGQLKRIKRDEALRLGLDKMSISTNGEEQEVTLLEIEFIPLWLTGIKINQCREEVREFLLDFKLKAKDVLAEAFFPKEIIQEETKQLIFELDENEKQRDVCINRLIGYMKDVVALEEEIRKLSKELKIKLSFLRVDTDTYYDSLR